MKKQYSTEICLPILARLMLKNVAEEGVERINEIIKELHAEHPEAFHSKDSLQEREFVHQPGSSIPYRRYMR
ncbi:hypothetical protein [Burkholderia cepacia]|uniref:hypothetical protein n=1 Tax=Burkholderia cepacia TaxID=292 RepID=UPI001589CE51|nr:hypothetical protein [Burkholderia cepacia]